MSHHLAPVIAASARWLVQGYAGPGIAALADVQARQAAMVAAWLRFPTDLDAALIHLTGPADSGRLTALSSPSALPADPWRTWIDEVVVSWAACLLTEAGLAREAVRAAMSTEHAAGLTWSFRCLVEPDGAETRAAALLRHPDLLAPVTTLHRAALVALLAAGGDRAATDPAPSTPSW